MSDLVVAGAAVVSAACAIAAAVYGHFQKGSARTSADAAARSADAAEKAEGHARRSADAAENVAQIEDDRAHHERRPDVQVRFAGQWVSESNLADVVIENRSGTTVASVTLELVGGPDLAGFGDDPTKPRQRSHMSSDLEPGIPDTARFSTVSAGAWEKKPVTFRVTATDGQRSWDPWLTDVQLPRPRPTIL